MRFLAPILSLGLIAGCATTPEPVGYESEAYQAQKYVREVLGVCDTVHERSLAGESPADCWYQYPRVMGMSFPSAYYHDQHTAQVGEFFNHWCASVEGATGGVPHFTRIFRRDQITQGLPCKDFRRGARP